MKKTKNEDPKYPMTVTLSSGEEITIPKQSEFDDAWLRKHGCSLIAEYMALQFLGVEKITLPGGKKVRPWPLHLLTWHKKHTPDEIFSKVTLRGVAKGISTLGGKKGSVIYSKYVTVSRIRAALASGAVVIMERKEPIHSITLVKDGEVIYRLNAGKAVRTTPEAAAGTATTSARYRGMIIVRKTK